MKFKKKSVAVEAVKWTGKNEKDIKDFAGNSEIFPKGTDVVKKPLRIATLEGITQADIGDFIIKGENGEFFPCKPDVFKKRYEVVED